MDYQEGYVYHIKDEYFTKANDPNLMQNKENGNYRPIFFVCVMKKHPCFGLFLLAVVLKNFATHLCIRSQISGTPFEMGVKAIL